MLSTVAVHAEEPTEECQQPQLLDNYKFLRRMSLDLKHKVPTYDEYLSIPSDAGYPESVVDDYLTSDEFTVVARRFHESLLWPNVTGVELTAFAFRIAEINTGVGSGKIFMQLAAQRKTTYRNDDVTCVDQPQEESLGGPGYHTGEVTLVDGSTLTWRYPVAIEETVGDTGKPVQREGYVMVHPYWIANPNTMVKVCAADALDAEIVPELKPNGTPVIDTVPGSPTEGFPITKVCTGGQGIQTKLCGAGPNLRWAYGSNVDQNFWDAMREQLLLLIDDHTVGGKAYSKMLTTDTSYTNGLLDYWSKHLATATNLNKTYNEHHIGDSELPEDPDFHDRTWREVQRNIVDGETTDMGHSGILTLPAYTLRFQTNRARANRFRTVFTKQYFIPPAAPEAEDSGECDPEAEDITKRCTCRYCHQVLEPMAAYWGGKVTEAGIALITDRDIFPIYQAQCDETGNVCCKVGGSRGEFVLAEDCAPDKVMASEECVNIQCAKFYQANPDLPNPGVLLPYQFAYVAEGQDPSAILDTLNVQISLNLESGPRVFAQQVIDGGQFHSAMVQHLFEYFMGREMILDPALPRNEIELLKTLTDEFHGHDDFRTIVKRIVLLEQYRRGR
jgi:hypothetical protein